MFGWFVVLLVIIIFFLFDDWFRKKRGPTGFGRKEDVSRGVVILR